MTEADFAVRESCEHGRVDIRSAVDPVSLQADPVRKAGFRNALASAVRSGTRGVVTHDIEVTLLWYVEESRRYQTHLVADLDNVLKPLLDAVTGADGIMIDDNQVQSIRASWLTPGARTGFDLEFRALSADGYMSREGISFMEFGADRCYILPQAEKGVQDGFVRTYRAALAAYQGMLDEGIAESVARAVLPAARPFPRARLGTFTVVRHADS
ncbi:hypothetical protein GCM10018785_60650 [Streptomyces longispororuber]|uniref:Uncharacterized protein n=1 Tax=Streptomyces longispororuber TaxID=68230 RepID=A0A919DW46_9ACTN|nr:RusA family crossover junction endodeoxyribonuclease [Streptomyces longispororuber]GHE84587.1 hypothetical protein GCM10018785_60650 [Streptomyces longispororuber]